MKLAELVLSSLWVLRRGSVWLLQLPIHVYRLVLSPLLPAQCRFAPSCSAYALQALSVHGPIRGSWLAIRRITRCHPLNPGGYDPVPPKRVPNGRPPAD